MPTVYERLDKLEAALLNEESAKDELAKAQDDIVRLRENLRAVYKFIEDNIGIRDASLDRRLKEPVEVPSL